jgi:phosphopantetheine--protein transferase-like protein
MSGSTKDGSVNVIGHGIDLVDVAEMRPWIKDPRDPLIPRCFVQAELDEIGDGANRIERLAGRFAAKEAVLKALGTGFCAGSRRQLPIRTVRRIATWFDSFLN